MKTILLIISLLILTSCFDLFTRNYWEEGVYYVTDNPGGANIKTLYIEVGSGSGHGRVDYVEAIGSNDTYIIVRSSNSLQEYWILDKKKDNHYLNSDEIVEGPFTLIEFNVKKKKLKINDLKFSEKW